MPNGKFHKRAGAKGAKRSARHVQRVVRRVGLNGDGLPLRIEVATLAHKLFCEADAIKARARRLVALHSEMADEMKPRELAKLFARMVRRDPQFASLGQAIQDLVTRSA